MASIRSLLPAVSRVLGVRGLGIVLQLAWFMLLVRALPIEQVGIYSAINTIWILLRALGPAGADMALLRVVPPLVQAGELAQGRAWLSRAVRHSLRWQSVFWLVAINAAVVADHLGYWVLSWQWLVLVVAGSVIYSLGGLLSHMLLAAEKPVRGYAPDAIALPLLLMVLLAVLGATDALTLNALLLGQVAIALVMLAVYGALVGGCYRGGAKRLLAQPDIDDFARLARTLFGTLACHNLTMRLPVIAGPVLVGAAATAVLEVAVRFATLLGLVQWSVGLVVLPKISQRSAHNDKAGLQQLLISSCWLVLVPTLLGFAVLAVAGEWLIVLITDAAYRAAYVPMLLVCAGMAVNAASGPTTHIYNLSGRAATVLAVSASEVVLLLVALVAASLVAGVAGIAAAMLAMLAYRNALLNALLMRQTGLRPGVWSASSVARLLR